MKLWYTGFNLYNQFDSPEEPIIQDFTLAEDASLNSIIPSHTYIIRQDSNDVNIRGAFHEDISLEKEKNVKCIVAVDTIVFILYNDGVIKRINTATGTVNYVDSFLNVENPDDDQDYITAIACGSKINAAVSNSNKIFNIPNRLEYKGRKIKEIVAGHEHCLILDSNGDVYSFGCGIRGQLGHGTLENETNPKLIEALAGVKISQIAAGGWHSCAISVTGDLYTWGWNSNGQLALPTKEDVSVFATPQPICLDDPDCSVDDVACGSKHTVIRQGNQIFGAGWNKYKQLGKPKDENIYEFKLLKDFHHGSIRSIVCGPWCTAVLTE